MLLHAVLSKKNLSIWNYVIKVVGWMKSLSAANLLRAVNQFLYSGFYYALLDEILKCDHSNESYWAVLSCGTVNYAVRGGSNFWVCGWNSKSVTIQMKATEQYFPVVLLMMLYKVVLTF